MCRIETDKRRVFSVVKTKLDSDLILNCDCSSTPQSFAVIRSHAKCNLAIFQPSSHLCYTFGTAPVTLGRVCEGRQEAESVVIIIATITQQQLLVLVPAAAHAAHK